MTQPVSDTGQQYSDAPEVVPGSGPEVAYDQAGMCFIQPDRDNHPEVHAPSAELKSGAHITSQKIPSPRRWWKRRRVWIILAGILLTVVALVVGLVVGLKSASPSDDAPETGDADTNADADVDLDSLCKGDVCRQVVATAAFRDELHIFIRSSNGSIQHRSGNGSSFDDSSWEDLSKAGTLTQPVAIAWKLNNTDRLDVFSVRSQDRTVYGLHLQDGEWSEWEEIAIGADSQPILCEIEDDFICMWTTDLDNHNITQNHWVKEENNFLSQSPGNGGKFRPTDTGPARSAAGIACREHRYRDIWHDISWYDRNNGSLMYRYYNGSAGFSKPRNFGGHFIGDPALVSFANNPHRLDFFGVGEDHQMYHLSLTDEESSKLKSLGGNVTSTPAVVSPRRGVMDVVALGRDGRIKHMHYNGSAWADEWEDLGVSALAAPQVVFFNGWVVLFALGKNEVRYAAWESGGGESSWAGLVKMKPLPGVIPSLDFFQEKL